MDLKELKEVIDEFNHFNGLSAWDLRYEEGLERDMRPSECEYEAHTHIMECLEEFNIDDEMEEHLKERIQHGFAGNDDHIWSPLLEEN